MKSLSCVRLFVTPWTAAHQAPPSMGFSRQEYWSGVPLPSPTSYLFYVTAHMSIPILQFIPAPLPTTVFNSLFSISVSLFQMCKFSVSVCVCIVGVFSFSFFFFFTANKNTTGKILKKKSYAHYSLRYKHFCLI